MATNYNNFKKNIYIRMVYLDLNTRIFNDKAIIDPHLIIVL